MRIYLDTEFNGFGGRLISLAMVTEDGAEWYEVLPLPQRIADWVSGNVIPFLNKAPIGEDAFMKSFDQFIRAYPGCEFIADWPADFQHLSERMNMLGSEADWKMPIECTMRLLFGSPAIKPEMPHNALSDARALRDWHKGELAAQEHTRIGQELGLD